MAEPTRAQVRRRVGRSAVEVTQLGLGGASLGDLFATISTADALGAVDSSWDAGVRYYDTAPWYGLGLSESRVGLGLHGRARGDFVLSSKQGRSPRR